jgi:hypothetical protein
MASATTHWRRLLVVTLGLMALLVAPPPGLPKPEMQENRVLASRPHLPAHWREARAFRKAVDAWVADQFPSRTLLIGTLNLLRLAVGVSGSPQVIVGRKGWLFYDDGSHLGAARNDPAVTPDRLEVLLDGMAGRTAWLKARGITYLVLAAPVKETVYPQFAPRWYKRPSPDRLASQLTRLAQTSQAGELVYPRDALAAAARRGMKVYSRHDTHWTGPGAYEGYAALMGRLHDLGVAEAPRPYGDFTPVELKGPYLPRDLALMLGVASFVHVDAPGLEDPVAEAAAKITYLGVRKDWTGLRTIDTGQTGKPVLLLTADSFSNALLPLLYGHFSRIIVDHNQNGTWRQDLIDRFHPDVVVLEVIEPGLGYSFAPAPAAAAEAAARIKGVMILETLRSPTPGAPAMQPTPARLKGELATARMAPGCNLETATVQRWKDGATLSVGGWISELVSRNTSQDGVLRLRGAVDITGSLRVDNARPDVAMAMGVAAAAASGFSGTFRITAPAGAYEAWIYRRSGAGWVGCHAAAAVIAP